MLELELGVGGGGCSLISYKVPHPTQLPPTTNPNSRWRRLPAFWCLSLSVRKSSYSLADTLFGSDGSFIAHHHDSKKLSAATAAAASCLLQHISFQSTVKSTWQFLRSVDSPQHYSIFSHLWFFLPVLLIIRGKKNFALKAGIPKWRKRSWKKRKEAQTKKKTSSTQLPEQTVFTNRMKTSYRDVRLINPKRLHSHYLEGAHFMLFMPHWLRCDGFVNVSSLRALVGVALSLHSHSINIYLA